MKNTKKARGPRWAAAQAVALLHLALAAVPAALMFLVEALMVLLETANQGLMWMLKGTLRAGEEVANRIHPRPEA